MAEVEVMLFQTSQYFVHHLVLFVKGAAESEDAIQVHCNFASGDKISRNSVHEWLEGDKQVDEAKEHHFWHKYSSYGCEQHLCWSQGLTDIWL